MLKKDITFIYMESAEKATMTQLAEEAKKRGYNVTLTKDKFAKCEIGVYCQHTNFPQYSKFSVIMLHDMTQQYTNWPDIWMTEPWNRYDIGFLPSNKWIKNWKQSSHNYYARPKKGIYVAGWPKADRTAGIDIAAHRKSFYAEHGLDPNKKTILYAPAWENDNKQDDFVQAMLKLDVNILVKQHNAIPDLFPGQYKCINEMYELHKNNPRVTILDMNMNIFDAILASDVLVSEESSTMSEAVMMGIPAVSVSNWLIPDVTPKRYPKNDYDFVIATKKENLTECISKIISDYDTYKKQTYAHRDNIFCNIGKASSIIMDIIDDYVNETEPRYPSIEPMPLKKLSFKKYIKHVYIFLNRQINGNYSKRYKIVYVFWNILKKIKNIFIKSNYSYK